MFFFFGESHSHARAHLHARVRECTRAIASNHGSVSRYHLILLRRDEILTLLSPPKNQNLWKTQPKRKNGAGAFAPSGTADAGEVLEQLQNMLADTEAAIEEDPENEALKGQRTFFENQVERTQLNASFVERLRRGHRTLPALGWAPGDGGNRVLGDRQ